MTPCFWPTTSNTRFSWLRERATQRLRERCVSEELYVGFSAFPDSFGVPRLQTHPPPPWLVGGWVGLSPAVSLSLCS